MKLNVLRRDFEFTLGLLRKQPFDVQLQITNRCNMKCSFCDFWPNGAAIKEELSVAEYQKLSQDLAKLGTFIVSIEGGEPFVRDDLIEIVKVFAEQHLVFLYTNGWHVDNQNASALFDAGLKQVGISIDFPDAARHDAKRGLPGAFQRAWQAVEAFSNAAPHGGKQVHVITVLMRENQNDIEPLLQLSAAKKVRHYLTLLSTKGYRRGKGIDFMPDQPISQKLLQLHKQYSNLAVFQDYIGLIDTFINGDEMPVCRAGRQTFNIDHLGYVAPCVEKIDQPVGNLRNESIVTIYQKMQELESIKHCQDCWSLCRGTSQALGNGGSLRGWWDMATRMKSY